MTADANVASEQKSFEAEVGRLLHMMVHSVYSERDIFLRELISNASDACDKLRYEAISTPGLIGPDERLAITIKVEPETGTLIVADNGIGMDRGELIENLGTIARSGTRAFLEKLAEKSEGASLIGQFGVGFYSAFMVADEIAVVSHKAGAAQHDGARPAAHVWSSNGIDGYTIRPATEAETARVARGTEIRLKLKDDAREFLEPSKLERTVKTYSDHILFPVELVTVAVADADLEDDADNGSRAEPGTGSAAARQINTASAIWQRSKSEVTAEQYRDCYQGLGAAFDGPRLTIHYRAEGRQEFAVLLFIPEQRPFDLFDPARKGRIKLYVRRVFITDEADLMPSYLRFVRGIVDSEDLPLNISREMLQSSPAVVQMRRALTTRVLSELSTFATRDADGYAAFTDTFGAVLKEALYEDFERRDEVLKLARFKTSTSGNAWRSLGQHVADFRPNQTAIYYLLGDNVERLRSSPQLEAAAARGLEVLLLTDPVDSFWTTMRPDYEGKPLVSLSQGDVDLTLVPLLDTSKAAPETSGKAAVLAVRLKEALGTAVSDVKVSARLVSSAVCLVAPGAGPDLALDRLLSKRDQGFGVKPVLEINPDHPLLAKLAEAGTSIAGDEFSDIAQMLFDQARILDGEQPADPMRFAATLNRLAVRGLS